MRMLQCEWDRCRGEARRCTRTATTCSTTRLCAAHGITRRAYVLQGTSILCHCYLDAAMCTVAM
jgi:hypothetical protein